MSLKGDQNIPKHWEVKELQELLNFVIGGDWGKDESYADENYDFAYCIRGAEIRNWNTEKGNTASLRKIKKTNIEKRKLQDGDILVEISGGGPEQPVGRTVLIDKSVLAYQPDVPKVCTNFLRLIRPGDGINSRFLNYFLTFFYVSGDIVNYQAGSNNLRNLKFPDYVKILIPIPPLSEQQSIVSRIEELFSELDNSVAQLKTAQQQLKTYRQSILKAAFEGKLTEEWRKKYLSSRGPEPSVTIRNFMGQLAAEPEVQYQTKNELPEGWKLVKIEEIINNLDQGWSPKCENHPGKEDEWSVIKTTAVQYGRFNATENKKLPANLIPRKQHELVTGDILITRAGPRVRVGVCCLVKNIRRKLLNCDKVYRIKLNDKLVLNEYFEMLLNSEKYIREIERMKTGISDSGVNLTQKGFLNIHLPLPTIAEQKTITEFIEEKISIGDNLEQNITQSLQQAEALRQSILKQAFEGKLV